MALPWIFANEATIASVQWDDNYAALGALTPIPCSVAGTNALALTPLTNTPTIAAYENYGIYTGIVQADNTTAVTAAVGGLAALNVYKDTGAGPVALTAADLKTGNAFSLLYDSSLNTGAGGFHLTSAGPSAGSGTFLPLAGGTLTGSLVGVGATFSGPFIVGAGTVAGVTITSPGAISAAGTISGLSINSTGRLSGASIFGTGITAAGALAGVSLAVNAGSPVTRVLSTIASVTFSVVAAGATQDQPMSIAGVQIGDNVMVGLPSNVATGFVYNGYVSVAGVVQVRAANVTGGTLTPTGGLYRATALGFT